MLDLKDVRIHLGFSVIWAYLFVPSPDIYIASYILTKSLSSVNYCSGFCGYLFPGTWPHFSSPLAWLIPSLSLYLAVTSPTMTHLWSLLIFLFVFLLLLHYFYICMALIMSTDILKATG